MKHSELIHNLGVFCVDKTLGQDPRAYFSSAKTNVILDK